MANPQVEEGHLDIANEIGEAFFKLQLSGNQWRVLWVILRQTYGWHKKTDRISISYFERKTGMKRRHISRALKDMVNREIITKIDTTFITTYGFQKDYTKWQLSPKMSYVQNGDGLSPKMSLKLSPKMSHTKETQKKLPKRKHYVQDFESFWSVYPRKVGKQAAFKAWEKQRGKGLLPPLDRIIATVEHHKKTDQWQRDNGQYIPHPTTWLNQGRWEDEIEAKASW